MHTIHDDIRGEVARCVAEGAILHVAPAAERIAAANPASGLSPDAIASMLVTAGVSAAVPMEIEMPERRRGAGSANVERNPPTTFNRPAVRSG